MSKKDFEKICDTVASISPFIRFTGVNWGEWGVISLQTKTRTSSTSK